MLLPLALQEREDAYIQEFSRWVPDWFQGLLPNDFNMRTPPPLRRGGRADVMMERYLKESARPGRSDRSCNMCLTSRATPILR